MAKGPRYRVPYRRRREHKTDYKKRRTLVTTSDVRMVVRPSDHNILVQVVKSDINGDYVLAQASSSELVKRFGWLGGTKNTPAAYLLGLLAGHKALRNGIERASLDISLRNPTKGSKLFAAVKGASEAGLEVPCDGDVIPGPERLEGSTIAAYWRGITEQPAEGEHRFSRIIRRGIRPEGLPGHFREAKARIEEAFSG